MKKGSSCVCARAYDTLFFFFSLTEPRCKAAGFDPWWAWVEGDDRSSFDDLGSAVEHFLEAEFGGRRAVLVGESFGGLLALDVATRLSERQRPATRLAMWDSTLGFSRVGETGVRGSSVRSNVSRQATGHVLRVFGTLDGSRIGYLKRTVVTRREVNANRVPVVGGRRTPERR